MSGVLRIARILAPVTVLGPGRRVGLWVQGCTLSCPGCASMDTWDPASGRMMTTAEVAASIVGAAEADPTITGVTITGGEPIQQGHALADMLAAVRRTQRGRDVDVLVFTGYSFEAAQRRAPNLLDAVDAVVTGRYDATAGHGGPLRGSANQRLHRLSDRFPSMTEDTAPTIQATVIDGDIVMVGIPAPGDLDTFRILLADRGVSLGEVSWRS